MRGFRLWLFAVVAAVAIGVICGFTLKARSSSEEPITGWQGKIDPKVVLANNDFGLRMLAQLVKEDDGKDDVIISPASLSLALSMTYNGAGGMTKNAMAQALGYAGLTLEQVNAGNRALLGSFRQPGDGIQLQVANSLWAAQDTEFQKDFLQRNDDFYQAQVTTLDFSDRNSAGKINDWISEKTKGKIDSIIGDTDLRDVLYLVNALCFDGLWSAPFAKELTDDGTFTTADGSKRNVRMMHECDQYEYLQGDGFQLINLPYGKGRISMYVLLPDEKLSTSPGSLAKMLTSANAEKWFKQIHDHIEKVDLSLPRFKLEMKFEREMKQALSALGMGVAFDPEQADFRAMCKIPPTPNVFIAQVVHKIYIDVNENGTEAAAVTAVTPMALGVNPSAPAVPVMTVDHPFFFAIRDNMTGQLLFVGWVPDPDPPVMLGRSRTDN